MSHPRVTPFSIQRSTFSRALGRLSEIESNSITKSGQRRGKPVSLSLVNPFSFCGRTYDASGLNIEPSARKKVPLESNTIPRSWVIHQEYSWDPISAFPLLVNPPAGGCVR